MHSDGDLPARSVAALEPAAAPMGAHAIHRSEVASVGLVTIPEREYAELLRCRQKVSELAVRERALMAISRSPIERDPVVAVFLADGLGADPVPRLRRRCLRKFGRTRTPSQSAIYRYWKRLRSSAPV